MAAATHQMGAPTALVETLPPSSALRLLQLRQRSPSHSEALFSPQLTPPTPVTPAALATKHAHGATSRALREEGKTEVEELTKRQPPSDAEEAAGVVKPAAAAATTVKAEAPEAFAGPDPSDQAAASDGVLVAAEITSRCVRNISAESNEASIDGGDGREGGASGDGDCADIVAVGPREIQSGGPITVVKCVVCLVRA